MSFSWLSIMGMYEYDPTIMDGLNVPDGLNKEDVINNIMLECAELEVIYPDSEVMKGAISVWSNSNQISWNKLYNTMTIEYNPIWNVDANVTINRNTSGDSESVDAVQGFNSSEWANSDKNNTDYEGAETVVERRTGNIGVTTTQQMLEQERAIADFNMIKYITDSFKKRFCLMIY